MNARLAQQGKLLAYTLIDSAGHGGAQFSEAANVKLVMDFLNKYLK